MYFREKKLPMVPETLLKRRKKQEDVRKARAFAREATKKVSYTSVLNPITKG